MGRSGHLCLAGLARAFVANRASNALKRDRDAGLKKQLCAFLPDSRSKCKASAKGLEMQGETSPFLGVGSHDVLASAVFVLGQLCHFMWAIDCEPRRTDAMDTPEQVQDRLSSRCLLLVARRPKADPKQPRSLPQTASQLRQQRLRGFARLVDNQNQFWTPACLYPMRSILDNAKRAPTGVVKNFIERHFSAANSPTVDRHCLPFEPTRGSCTNWPR